MEGNERTPFQRDIMREFTARNIHLSWEQVRYLSSRELNFTTVADIIDYYSQQAV